jgi:sarcosine oxidase subunit beta
MSGRIPEETLRVTHFSALSLLKNALTGNKNWTEQWPDAQPKAGYDVVIVGAGGHGLGAAYYLAARHGITKVAVIDKGWLGGGNTGRNTAIVRSNYLYGESAKLYDHALDLWDNLSRALNYNVMHSKRGVMMLAHNVHDAQSFQRHIHSNRLNGVDNQWLTP